MSSAIDRRKLLSLAAGAVLLPALPAGAQTDRNFLIFFDFNLSELGESGRQLADALIEAIPETGRVTLTGHCDAAERDPEKLGFARANAVLTHLLRDRRMVRVRFNVLNEAASKPLARGNAQEPRNRRVEIAVV